MKKQNGFANIALVIAIVIIAGAVGYFGLIKTGPIGYQTPTPTPKDETASWKTYKNIKKGYEISYPTDAKIDYTDLSCVRIDTKEFGAVYINAVSSNPCGEPTGIGIDNIRIKENIAMGNKQYTASGFRLPDNSFSFLSFGFTTDDKIFVTYGASHFNKNDPKNWKNLGALTDLEYQDAINSAKKIVLTLKLLSSLSETAETANWKTYTNTKYGFEFKYPAGTELRTSYSAKEGGPATGRDDNVYVGSFLQIELINPLGNCSDLRSESAVRACLGSHLWVQNDIWTPVTIGGQPAVRREVQPKTVGYIWYVNYGKIGFQIAGPVSEADQVPTTEKILSTFKFTR